MPITMHGISTTTAPGQEQYEIFHINGRKLVKNIRCQYDYRHPDGELFSCVGKSLEECRARREAWLEKKAA